MDLTEKISRIRLIRTRNVGPMTYGLLMQRYGSAIATIEAIPDLAKRGGRQLKPASIDLAKDELAHNQAAGATMLFRGGDGYPARLGQFDDAPPVISVKGNANLLNRPLVAIVGARNASINALRHAESLASELSQNGYVIVSGLARGIDGARIMAPLMEAQSPLLQAESTITTHQKTKNCSMPLKNPALSLPRCRQPPSPHRTISPFAIGLLPV
jgi:DNA processing protein